jgi:hypothetical protein
MSHPPVSARDGSVDIDKLIDNSGCSKVRRGTRGSGEPDA